MREIKFRLVANGKIVGYERHIICAGTVSIQHQKVGEDIWRFIYPNFKYWVPHDHKDYFIDLLDKNGNAVYENSDVLANGYKAAVVWDEAEKQFRLQSVHYDKLYDYMGSKFAWEEIELIEEK